MTKREIPEFVCSSCHQKFLALDSFHGECRTPRGDVKDIELCSKCLVETVALWDGEPKTIERQLQEKIEYWTRQHGKNRHADAKRSAYEEVFDLLKNRCIIFDGNNARSIWGRDLTDVELIARKTLHAFGINFEEQIELSEGNLYRYRADIFIPTKGKGVVVECDGSYYHRTDDQKDRDSRKDFILTSCGYTVVRISEHIIRNDTPQFRTRILDAIYNKKQRNTKASLPTQIPLSRTVT